MDEEDIEDWYAGHGEWCCIDCRYEFDRYDDANSELGGLSSDLRLELRRLGIILSGIPDNRTIMSNIFK